MKNEAYSTHLEHLVELQGFIGKEIGISPWIKITQDMINTFGKLTQDEQWIHVDEEKAKQFSPYQQTVAHGFMVLSFASRVAYDTMSIGDITMGVNYGLDKVRNPSPTPAGAEVRGRVSVMTFDPFEGGARYKLLITFEMKDQEKPVCVAEFIAQAYTGK